MKSNHLLKLAVVALSLAGLGFVHPEARAQSVVFQQNANGQPLGLDSCGVQHFASNSNLWTQSSATGLDCNMNSYIADVSNWELAAYPDGNFNVTIPPTSRAPELPQGAHLNESVTVNNLTILENALLSYDANNSSGAGAHPVNLTLNGGTVTNNGTLKSIGPTEAGQTYTFAVDTLLSGTGTTNFGYGTTLAGPGTLTIDSAHSVIGGGNVTSLLPLVNHGVITADGSSGFFTHNLITFMDSHVTNTGTLETTASGAIQFLQNVTVNNTGGTLRSSSSDRFNIMSGAQVTGGTLESNSDNPNRMDLFYINTATLNDVNIADGTKIQVDGGILTLNGAITNNGQFLFADTQNPAGTGRFNIASDTTLSGTGLIVVVGAPNTVAPGKTLTLGEGQTLHAGFTTITGAISNHGLINAASDRGLILNGGDFVNDGTIQASGASLLSFGVTAPAIFTIDNTDGTIRAEGTSIVAFQGDILVRNGTLATADTGYITNIGRVTLENVTNNGLFHITRSCAGTVTLQISGSLTNNGTIDDLQGECGPINITLLGDVSINGNGSFVLYRGATIDSTNGVLTNGSNHTINGNVTINPVLINNGTAVVGGNNTLTLAGPSVTNNGTLWASSGSLENAIIQQAANSTLTNYDPVTQILTGGTFIAMAAPQSGARLSLNIGPVMVNNATVILSGAGAQFEPISSIHENEGTLGVLEGKIFSTTAPRPAPPGVTQPDASDSLVNSGTLKLDQNSSINVNGNFAQGSNAVFYLEIGANGPNPDFHQLNASGTAALAGTLNVRLVNGFVPAPDQTFTIINSAGISGGFAQVHGADVTYTSTSVIIHPNGLLIPPATPKQPLNISTRMPVKTDPGQLIGGFIVTGTEAKRVIVLATGPSLSAFGIPGVLADPILELYQGNTLIATNDNWKLPDQAEIEATGLQPTDDLESALVRTLAPGAYTAIVRGTSAGTGVGVVQLFDLGLATDSKLANISSRGFVEAGDSVMIAGFILGGDVGENSRVAIRAIGPSLNPFLSGALQDPTLELKDANGSTLKSNDDWRVDGQQGELQALGLVPTDDHEAALVTTLPRGSYTAIVRGKSGTTGVAVVEVYNVP